MFKSITLPSTTWDKVIAKLSADADFAGVAAAISEQASGTISVRVSRGAVSVKTKKGLDLRLSATAKQLHA